MLYEQLSGGSGLNLYGPSFFYKTMQLLIASGKFWKLWTSGTGRTFPNLPIHRIYLRVMSCSLGSRKTFVDSGLRTMKPSVQRTRLLCVKWPLQDYKLAFGLVNRWRKCVNLDGACVE